MATNERPSQRCELGEAADLLTALDAPMIEHLPVDEHRTFVIYDDAVLELRATDGTLTATRAFTIECVDVAHYVTDPDPEGVVTAVCETVVAATDTACDERH
jgi:hypothetical protein